MANAAINRFHVVVRNTGKDGPVVAIFHGAQPCGVDGIEMVAHRPYGPVGIVGVRVLLQAVNVLGFYLRRAGHRHDDTGVVQSLRRPHDDAGMLANELGRVGIMRKIHPEILGDAGRAVDKPPPAARPYEAVAGAKLVKLRTRKRGRRFILTRGRW